MSICPGATQLTRMPYGAPSSAADFVRPSTACLEAMYGENVAAPLIAAIDAVFTIAPEPCGFITFRTARSPMNTPRALTAQTLSKSATESSVIGAIRPSIPALLKNRSIRPCASTAA